MTDQPRTETLPPPGTKMSAEEFLALPETMTRIELINGIVTYPFGILEEGDEIMSPAPIVSHQRLVWRLAKLIERTVGEDRGEVLISPVAFHFGSHDVVEPGVAWIAPDSACVFVGDRHFKGAPDLVVEVPSPSTAKCDQTEKLALYEKYGTQEYWIGNKNERTLTVFQRDGDKLVKIGTFTEGDSFHSTALNRTVTLTGIFIGLVG